MQRWNELPLEILNMILENPTLGRGDFYNCLFCCKSWKPSVELCLYRSVLLDKPWRMLRFIECLESSKMGKLIKEIDFFSLVDPFTYDETQGCLRRIAPFTPNVERITALTPCNSFWLDLVYVSFSHWKKLREIPDPSRNYVEYTLCILTFRNSLRRIAIPNCHPQSSWGEDIVDSLKTFPQIDTIVIKEAHRVLRLIDYDPVIEGCPNLINLEVRIKEYREEDQLLDWEEEDMDLSVQYTVNDLNSRPHIKRLQLEVNYDDDLINYLMHKFPNLDELILTVHSGNDSGQQYESITGKDNAFFSYIMKIPKHSIKLSCSAEHVRLFLEMSQPTQVHFFGEFDPEFSLFAPLLLEAGMKPLTMEINSEKPTKLSAMGTLKRDDLKEIWKGCQNSALEITFSSGEDFSEYIGYREERDKCIEDILSYCRKLKTLSYTSGNLQSLSREVVKRKSINRSLENLTLKLVHFESKSLAQYSSLLPSLKYFKLTSFVKITGKRDNLFEVRMPSATLEKLDLDLSFLWERSVNFWKSPAKDSIQNQRIKAVQLIVITLGTAKKKYVIKSFRGKVTVKEGVDLPKSSYSVTVRVHCRSLKYVSVDIGAVKIKNCLLSKWLA